MHPTVPHSLKRVIPKAKQSLARRLGPIISTHVQDSTVALPHQNGTDNPHLHLSPNPWPAAPKTLHSWNRLHPSLGNFVGNPANALAVNRMPVDLIERLAKDPSPETDLEAYQSTLASSTKWLNEMVATQMKTPTGEAAYTKDVLQVYDAMIWRHNAPFHWRMHQEEAQGLYNDCLLDSSSHCEVAVGTGLFLAELDTKQCSNLRKVTLMDLQENALETCAELLSNTPYYGDGNVEIDSILANILDDVQPHMQHSYDTVAANYLVHCLPSGDDIIHRTFFNCASMLRPTSGLFFGSTILGHDLLQDGDRAGKATIDAFEWYNQVGVFGCKNHTYQDVSRILHDLFEDVEIWRVGYCVAWKARGPKV